VKIKGSEKKNGEWKMEDVFFNQSRKIFDQSKIIYRSIKKNHRSIVVKELKLD
jgi:hypothetical protein